MYPAVGHPTITSVGGIRKKGECEEESMSQQRVTLALEQDTGSSGHRVRVWKDFSQTR